jgi:type IV pilus assembly protein PilV
MFAPLASSRTAGSALIESLLALVVFSVGLLSLLVLLTSSLKQSDNARYRSEASLLASDLIGQMWSGDRSLKSLRQRFDSASDEYQRWLVRVQATLPGLATDRNQPELLIDDSRNITLTLHWQAPSDTEQHQLVVVTRLTD